MARTQRSAKLETRSARLRLAIRRKTYTVKVAPGIRLGYRRTSSAGTWSVIIADGRGGATIRKFALADDYETANGASVLDYWQAFDRARSLARASDQGAERPVTVADALEAFEADLSARGGDPYNARRVLFHLPPKLASRAVALLTAAELRTWRDSLLAKMTPGSAGRTARMLAAALTLAARGDRRCITNRDEWRFGLERLPDSERQRNVILTENEVRAVVTAAYAVGHELGLFIEVAAVTGARPSQLALLRQEDIEDDPPRLMLPSSLKGKGRKLRIRRPVPIPAALAAVLRDGSSPPDTPLLTRASGQPWGRSDHRRPFREAAAKADLDPNVVTLYALRHSSIVRQLLAGVPVRVVATMHDTSIGQIERTYSKHIGEHSDALVRRALIDLR